jgi:nitrogen regulatory protein P-II 2
MKKIEILIPGVAFNSIKLSLMERFNCEIGSYSITVHAKDMNRTERYRGSKYIVDFSEKVVVSLKISEELLPDLLATVGRVMDNGKFGEWEMTETPVEFCGRTGWRDHPRLARPKVGRLCA